MVVLIKSRPRQRRTLSRKRNSDMYRMRCVFYVTHAAAAYARDGMNQGSHATRAVFLSSGWGAKRGGGLMSRDVAVQP